MDDKLSEALRSLPRVEVEPGFTADVLRRLDESPGRSSSAGFSWLAGPARWPMVAAAAAVLLIVAVGAREWWHFHQRSQVTARLAVLESERQALTEEIERLRSEMRQTQPVVYLGGNAEMDVVLDLAQLRRAGLRPGDIRPELLRGLALGGEPVRDSAGRLLDQPTAHHESFVLPRSRVRSSSWGQRPGVQPTEASLQNPRKIY